jgi:hypothetical protein
MRKEAAAPVLQQVGRQLHAVLVGHGAGVDDVGRVFEALVERAIPEQRVVALDHRQHGLAARRARAAEDHVDFVLQQEPRREPPVFVGIALGVVGHRQQRAVEHAAESVDFLDGQRGAEKMLRLGHAGGARARMQHADAPAVVGRGGFVGGHRLSPSSFKQGANPGHALLGASMIRALRVALTPEDARRPTPAAPPALAHRPRRPARLA